MRSLAWVALGVLGILGSTACEQQEQAQDSYWESMLSSTFAQSKPVSLNALYQDMTGLVVAEAFADVPDQTAGVIEIEGPRHLLCPGAFVGHARFTEGSPRTALLWQAFWDLPQFQAGGAEIMFQGPKGDYTAYVRIPPYGVVISRSFTASAEGGGYGRGTYLTPHACREV